MADFNNLGVALLPFKAGGSIGQNRLVKLDSTAGQVVVTSAITDAAVGVATVSASSGDLVSVQCVGVAKLVASGAVSLGDEVMPTASGSGKVVTSSGATARSIGVALEAAGADGDVIAVLLCTPALKGPANS